MEEFQRKKVSIAEQLFPERVDFLNQNVWRSIIYSSSQNRYFIVFYFDKIKTFLIIYAVLSRSFHHMFTNSMSMNPNPHFMLFIQIILHPSTMIYRTRVVPQCCCTAFSFYRWIKFSNRLWFKRHCFVGIRLSEMVE